MAIQESPVELEPLAESTDFSLYGEGDGISRRFDALFQSVESIIEENKYSSFFRYENGLNIDEKLFATNNEHLAIILASQLSEGIRLQDPRISEVNIKITHDIDEKEVFMDIALQTIEFGTSETRRYSL